MYVRKSWPLDKRFWSHTRIIDGCWVWTGAHNRKYYGQISMYFPPNNARKIISAHRFSWELHHAKEVPAGMMVCHTCDNPSCVNPAHLYLGTAKTNKHDAVKKMRHTYGTRIHRSILTESLVRRIRDLHRTNFTISKIRDLLETSYQAIYGVVTGETWKHVS